MQLNATSLSEPPFPPFFDLKDLGLGRKPVVWYGSSITQGACASKPGDAYTNAIARAISRPVSNFGFSGSCLYEQAVMDFLLRIDAAAYIVDCNVSFVLFSTSWMQCCAYCAVSCKSMYLTCDLGTAKHRSARC